MLANRFNSRLAIRVHTCSWTLIFHTETRHETCCQKRNNTEHGHGPVVNAKRKWITTAASIGYRNQSRSQVCWTKAFSLLAAFAATHTCRSAGCPHTSRPGAYSKRIDGALPILHQWTSRDFMLHQPRPLSNTNANSWCLVVRWSTLLMPTLFLALVTSRKPQSFARRALRLGLGVFVSISALECYNERNSTSLANSPGKNSPASIPWCHPLGSQLCRETNSLAGGLFHAGPQVVTSASRQYESLVEYDWFAPYPSE